jgi:tetratricopeptide (TPR) repeat protein
MRTKEILAAAVFLFFVLQGHAAPAEGYVGVKVCAQCHQSRVEEQAASNHARTWRPAWPVSDLTLPQKITEETAAAKSRERLSGKALEAGSQPISYAIDATQNQWSYRLRLLGRPAQSFPLHAIVGGKRFGFSFIVKTSHVESKPLSRTALIEGRYMLDAKTQRLKLSPGFPTDKPRNYESAIGRVLSPEFSEKCMDCHGGTLEINDALGSFHPRYLDTSVRCERCHGPGAAHVAAAQAHQKELHILHPGRLSNPERMQLCAKCHSGFARVVQPRPDDVLISNQVTALSESECYIQSGAGFSCVSCHNPHRNAQHQDPVYEKVCLSCHSSEQTATVHCPVNPRSGCIPCHMPEVIKPGSFKLTDHWIRIPSKDGKSTGNQPPSAISGQQPAGKAAAADLPKLKRLFLRILIVSTEAQAIDLWEKLKNGMPFEKLARQFSVDVTAPRGGYMGEIWLEKMSEDFRKVALSLKPGAFSTVFRSGSEYGLLYRMPRNFRDQARRMQEEGDRLRTEKQIGKALEFYGRSVEMYPDFVHGYFSQALAYGQAGDVAKERENYLAALRIAPDFHPGHYNLGQMLMSQGDLRGAILEFEQAIRIKPDLAEAYVNLSAIHQAQGDSAGAIKSAQRAIETNPLLASAYYNLGTAQVTIDLESAHRSFDLAATIDRENWGARLNAAIALAKLGKTGEAVARLKQVLLEKPDFSAAREVLSELEDAKKRK